MYMGSIPSAMPERRLESVVQLTPSGYWFKLTSPVSCQCAVALRRRGVANRQKDVGLTVSKFKKFGLLIGGLFGIVIQNKHEEKTKPPPKVRDQTFRCFYCKVKFREAGSLNKHLKFFHGIDPDKRTH
jgi:hypothetical protein